MCDMWQADANMPDIDNQGVYSITQDLPETLSGIWVLIHKLFLGETYTDTLFLIYLISYPIRLLACLMYNEIIILNFCRLNENTVGQIHKRSEVEFKKNEIEMTMVDEIEADND